MSGSECPDCGEYFLDCTCERNWESSENTYFALVSLMKAIFLDYFSTVPDGTLEHFKSITFEGINSISDTLYEKYADHIEGLQKESRDNDARNSTDSQTS